MLIAMDDSATMQGPVVVSNDNIHVVIRLTTMLKSIVMTMRNAEQWLDESLSSLYNQTHTGHMELSVYNDGSMVRT